MYNETTKAQTGRGCVVQGAFVSPHQKAHTRNEAVYQSRKGVF
jgi:hypothetical protein